MGEVGKFVAIGEYGTYWTWAQAKGVSTEYNYKIGAPAMGNSTGSDGSVCPKGWRLPNKDEFSTLTNQAYTTNTWSQGSGATNGLKVVSTNGSGATIYFPNVGGDGGSNSGSNGRYWSSTEYDATYAYRLYFNSLYSSGYFSYNNKTIAYAVRCARSA